MSFEDASRFTGTWGLVALALLFGLALLYALWPANGDRFRRAARTPLEDEADND